LAQKHAVFAPASQKRLGFRLRSPLRGTVPAQPSNGFFRQAAFAKQDYLSLGQKRRVFRTHWPELLRHTRRPISSDSLKERIQKAKSSMVAAAISQTSMSVIMDLELLLQDKGGGLLFWFIPRNPAVKIWYQRTGGF
jgi:hypothetical protein